MGESSMTGTHRRKMGSLEPLQHFRAGWRRVGFNELQLAGDAVEAGLDGGVANAEGLLHLLDGAVRAEEGDDEDLIFQAQTGKLRQGELAFDGDSLLRDTDALDEERTALGDAEQVLPVGGGFGG
jgi:hypothetical protein